MILKWIKAILLGDLMEAIYDMAITYSVHFELLNLLNRNIKMFNDSHIIKEFDDVR